VFGDERFRSFVIGLIGTGGFFLVPEKGRNVANDSARLIDSLLVFCFIKVYTKRDYRSLQNVAVITTPSSRLIYIIYILLEPTRVFRYPPQINDGRF